jgi:hypothetical protein
MVGDRSEARESLPGPSPIAHFEVCLIHLAAGRSRSHARTSDARASTSRPTPFEPLSQGPYGSMISVVTV